MLDLMGKGITVVLTLGITASAWAAPSLPGSSDDVRALEQNRGARQQQTDLQQTDLQQPEQQKAAEETLPSAAAICLYRPAGNRPGSID